MKGHRVKADMQMRIAYVNPCKEVCITISITRFFSLTISSYGFVFILLFSSSSCIYCNIRAHTYNPFRITAYQVSLRKRSFDLFLSFSCKFFDAWRISQDFNLRVYFNALANMHLWTHICICCTFIAHYTLRCCYRLLWNSHPMRDFSIFCYNSQK